MCLHGWNQLYVIFTFTSKSDYFCRFNRDFLNEIENLYRLSKMKVFASDFLSASDFFIAQRKVLFPNRLAVSETADFLNRLRHINSFLLEQKAKCPLWRICFDQILMNFCTYSARDDGITGREVRGLRMGQMIKF